MFNDPRDRSRDPGFYKDLEDVGKEQLGIPQGEETDDTETLRRIDQHMRSVASHGITPKARDPLLGLLPQTSPAGEAIGGALDAGGNLVRNVASAGLELSPGRLIEHGLGVLGDAGENVMDMMRWAVTPRAAFVPESVKQSADDKHSSASAVPGSQPTASQATDAAAKLTGVDSAHVAPQSVNSLATTREIESYYDRPQRGSIRVSEFADEPLREYDPSGDIGAPGGTFSQSRMEDIPIGQRPPSYFEDLAVQRAIDRGAPAEGDLAGTGLTREEAGRYYGQEFVNRGANDRAMRLEDFRQRGTASNEARRRQQYQSTVTAIREAHRAAVAQIEALPLTPEEIKKRIDIANERAGEAITDAKDAAGLASGRPPSEFYKQ